LKKSEEDKTKGTIKKHKSKEHKQHFGQNKIGERQPETHKTQHRKLKIEQHEPHKKRG